MLHGKSNNINTTLPIWSGRADSNRQPLVPETSVLSDCTTSRYKEMWCTQLYYNIFFMHIKLHFF